MIAQVINSIQFSIDIVKYEGRIINALDRAKNTNTFAVLVAHYCLLLQVAIFHEDLKTN